MSKPIHQEVTFPGTAQRIYDAYMVAEQHAAFTGGTAEISPEEGGTFSCFEGQIVGRNIELLPGQRIVQAWRVAAWPPGLYSVVQLELQAKGDETTVVMDHAGVPDEFEEHIAGGWHTRYWEPLLKHLS